jgi:hypothetical protein
MLVRLAIVLVLLAALSSCGSDSGEGEEVPVESEPGAPGIGQEGDVFPDVVEVTAKPTGERAFTFSVTISSPYDSPQRFADGWRILAPDGETIAEHELLHDHADEQPFTRTQTDVEVPRGVTELVVEPRDSENGYGGKTGTVALSEGD